MTDTNAMRLTAALVKLTEAGVPPDVLELLTHGNPNAGVAPGALGLALLATDRAAGVGERHSLGEGFGCQYDDDDYTITWPDGRWLVAHRCGKITTGKSPYDPAIPPRQTDIAALAARPAPAEDAVAAVIRNALYRSKLNGCSADVYDTADEIVTALAAMQPRGEQQAGREEGR